MGHGGNTHLKSTTHLLEISSLRKCRYLAKVSLGISILDHVTLGLNFLSAWSGSYQFTYRIRESSGNVIWLSQAAGDDNGTIVIKPSTSTADYDPVAKADETLEVVEEEREGDITTKTIAFALGAGHEGKVESFRMISLGGWSSGRAIERSKPTWFTARHLTPYSGLSPVSDCQLLLYHSGNQVVACFPLSLPDCWSVLRGCSEGSDTVWLRSERETARSAAAQCVVSWGPEHKLLEVIDSCTAQAKKIIDASAVQENATESDRRAQSRWSLRDTVKPVYCTWNSLGQKYTYSGLVRRLEALRASGDLPYFESLLLDDGWQDVAYSPENQNLRGLRSFGLRNGWLDEDIKPLENESMFLNTSLRLLGSTTERFWSKQASWQP